MRLCQRLQLMKIMQSAVDFMFKSVITGKLHNKVIANSAKSWFWKILQKSMDVEFIMC